MDSYQMKERNYRMVAQVRRQNLREQRHLEDALYSKRGLKAACLYHLDKLGREQELVRRELVRIQKTGSTTWGHLPPRNASWKNKELKTESDGKENATSVVSEHTADQPASENPLINPYLRMKIKAKRRRPVSFSMDIPRVDDKPNIDTLPMSDPKLKSPSNAPQTDHANISKDESQLDILASITSVAEENIPKEFPRTLRKVGIINPPMPLNEVDVFEAKNNISKRLVRQNNPDEHDGKAWQWDDMRFQNTLRTLTPIRENETQTEEPTDDKKLKRRSSLWITPSNFPPITESENGDVRRRSSVASFMTVSSDGERKSRYDYMRYNADGSLRTVHKMPSFDERFAQARKARYIRHREIPIEEQELTLAEIFERRSRRNSAASSRRGSVIRRASLIFSDGGSSHLE